MQLFFTILEHIGVIVFAISGAIVAIDRETDIFGVIILSYVTAFGGGIMRDVILGATPAFFTSYTEILVCFLTALAVILFAVISRHRFVKDERFLNSVNNYIDAIGVGVFSVSGVKIAIALGYTAPIIAIFMGVISSVGGGMLRDVLLRDIPFVLRKRVYAIASIIGASLYFLLWYIEVPDIAAMLIAVGVTVAIRVLATIFKWNIPKAINFSEMKKHSNQKYSK